MKEESNIRGKEDLGDFLKKVEKQQSLGPFNIRDSGVIEELQRKLEENAINYDNEPVVACPHCNSLYLIDIDKALECFNCGHEVLEKDVRVYRSIKNYLDEDNKNKNGA